MHRFVRNRTKYDLQNSGQFPYLLESPSYLEIWKLCSFESIPIWQKPYQDMAAGGSYWHLYQLDQLLRSPSDTASSTASSLGDICDNLEGHSSDECSTPTTVHDYKLQRHLDKKSDM